MSHARTRWSSEDRAGTERPRKGCAETRQLRDYRARTGQPRKLRGDRTTKGGLRGDGTTERGCARKKRQARTARDKTTQRGPHKDGTGRLSEDRATWRRPYEDGMTQQGLHHDKLKRGRHPRNHETPSNARAMQDTMKQGSCDKRRH